MCKSLHKWDYKTGEKETTNVCEEHACYSTEYIEHASMSLHRKRECHMSDGACETQRNRCCHMSNVVGRLDSERRVVA